MKVRYLNETAECESETFSTMGLNKLDLAIIAIYLAGITLFGLRFRKKQRTLRDYFLAGRDIPWWAIGLSIMAAETSTLTIISIPGLAYDTNLTFLQVVLGYLVGRIVISFVLLPHYFRGDLYTAYELIERRFGQRVAFAHCGIIPGHARGGGRRPRVCGFHCSVDRAGHWRDRVHRHHYRADADLHLRRRTRSRHLDRRCADCDLCRRHIGRTDHHHPTCSRGLGCYSLCRAGGGKASGFRFPSQCLAAVHVLGWSDWRSLFTTASHGTDQLIVQRLLAARGQKQSVTALLSSGVAILFQFALFLILGVMLWAFYRQPSAAFGRPDRIYPTFIVTHMPHGISGLLIAAVLAAAMSNLSAALNSLSSSAIMDFYARLRPQSDEKTKMRLSRLATLAWALILFGLAVIALHKVGRVVEVGLQIASVTYGALLGVFCSGP